MERETILLIEDDERDQNYIRQRIGKRYLLKIAPSYQDGLKALLREDFDYILLDLRLPKKVGAEVDERGTLGVKLLKTIKETLPLIPVVVVSGLPSPKIAIRLLKYGIVDFVEKDDLGDWLEALVKKGRLLKELCLQNKILRHEILGSPTFESLLIKSKLWNDIENTIRLAAPSEETVLITGETDTGKEVVAREIVNLSLRKEALYLPLNFTQVSPNLLDSELFGHEKGAFSGAENRKIGIFEAAHNGTVLLDEIGDISDDMQVKLLRFLENKEFHRVGGNDIKKVNVRIIAATSRNLEQMMERGGFRKDLFYRLNRIRIHIPPLRERKTDIELLARHFIKKYCRKHGKSEKQLNRRTLNRLKHYHWPGNVRELENLVSQAVLFSQSDTLSPEDFDIKVSESATEVIKSTDSFDLKMIEKEAIRQALSMFKTKKEVSRKLGITENTLKTKIDKYKLAHVRSLKKEIPEAKTVESCKNEETLSDEQLQILEHIKKNDFMNNKIARQKFGVSQKTVVLWCQDLMDKGLIIRDGKGRNAKYILNTKKTSELP